MMRSFVWPSQWQLCPLREGKEKVYISSLLLLCGTTDSSRASSLSFPWRKSSNSSVFSPLQMWQQSIYFRWLLRFRDAGFRRDGSAAKSQVNILVEEEEGEFEGGDQDQNGFRQARCRSARGESDPPPSYKPCRKIKFCRYRKFSLENSEFLNRFQRWT